MAPSHRETERGSGPVDDELIADGVALVRGGVHNDLAVDEGALERIVADGLAHDLHSAQRTTQRAAEGVRRTSSSYATTPSSVLGPSMRAPFSLLASTSFTSLMARWSWCWRRCFSMNVSYSGGQCADDERAAATAHIGAHIVLVVLGVGLGRRHHRSDGEVRALRLPEVVEVELVRLLGRVSACKTTGEGSGIPPCQSIGRRA